MTKILEMRLLKVFVSVKVKYPEEDEKLTSRDGDVKVKKLVSSKKIDKTISKEIYMRV